MALISVEDALARVLQSARLLPSERIPIAHAMGRTVSQALLAERTQPPFNSSAMDGYAVRGADIQTKGAKLNIVGESAAGHGFHGRLAQNQAVRIFTGAPVPDGADTILMQEYARREGDTVIVEEVERIGRHIRHVGLDFKQTDQLIAQGTRLNERTLALAAAMGHGHVTVTRKPKVAVLATGDELVEPGQPTAHDQIVASNHLTAAALIEAAGGEVLHLGIAADRFSSLERAIIAAESEAADILVTLGGASVGDHDLVQSVLTRRGMELGFWRIAMRPGKPLIHGTLGPMAILGLPGNPVSSYVCARVFLVPLIRAMAGDPLAAHDPSEPARLGVAVRENDKRQDYLRASLEVSQNDLPIVRPFELQDSSMIRVMAQAGALVIRKPFDEARPAGSLCRIIRL